MDRLGRSGKDRFDAIVHKDVHSLGAAMNERTQKCWRPSCRKRSGIRRFTLIEGDSRLLPARMRHVFRLRRGYLYVVSADKLPGTIKVRVRTGGLEPDDGEAGFRFGQFRRTCGSRQVRFCTKLRGWGKCTSSCGRIKHSSSVKETAEILPEAERKYLVEAVRYVDKVELAPEHVNPDCLPSIDSSATLDLGYGSGMASPARKILLRVEWNRMPGAGG